MDEEDEEFAELEEKMHHHHQSDSMDDFIVEDNPMDLDNIEAHKELAQMLGHDEQPDGAMWEFR